MVGLELLFLIGVILWSLGLFDSDNGVLEVKSEECEQHKWIIKSNGLMYCNKCNHKAE